MTKKNSTKKALITSALCLLLCVSMLVGATFAWFTDSVSSAKNQIVAGNLDVELEYAKVVNGTMTDWATVKDAANIFDPDALWEPGRVEVVYLKVSNLGTLALKYQLGVNVYGETAGTNVAGEPFKLSDYLVFKTVEMPDALTTYTDREAAQLASGSVKGLKDYNGATTALEVGGVDYVALIVYMPETVGNEANYRGNAVPTIELGVNLYATQQMAEEDSFGPDYDEDAKLPIGNAEDLAAAMTEGGIYVLAADIAVDANTAMTVPAGKEVILDLNGYDIDAASSATGKNRAAFCVKGEMTVIGNGTVTFVHTGENMGWGNLTAAFSVEGGELTLGEGVSVINYGGSNMAYGVDVNTTLGESVLNINGATILSTYTAVREFNNHATAKAIVNFNSGLISGDSRDIWVHNPSASAVDANGIVNNNTGIEPTVTVQAATSYYGRIYDFDYGYVLVNSASALQKALDAATDGTVIKLGVDLKGDVTATQKPDVKVTIDGNGNTFAGVITVDGQSATYMTAGLTIKNVVFKADSITADACVRLGDGTNATRYTCNVTVDNCTFDVPGAVGIKSYTGGDQNLVITNCTVTANAHSLVQVTNVEQGLTITNCVVNSKNGANLNNTPSLVMSGCTFNVQGYAVRLGVNNSTNNGTFKITDCTLTSACAEAGDAVIILRGNMAGATLDLAGTTLAGTSEIIGTANIINH